MTARMQRVLAVLAAEPSDQPLSIHEVASQLGSRRGHQAASLNALAKLDFVKRVPRPDGYQGPAYQITQLGIEALARAKAAR